MTTNALTVPPEIPIHVSTVPDEEASQRNETGIAGDIPGGIPDGVNGSVLEMMKPVAPPPAKPTVQKLRVSSGVAEGMLIHQVKPQYPAAAKLARVEGRVLLQAVIGKDGAIENLHAISGHPLLVSAAIDAVKQWRYKPYFLNGEPMEVETQIVVNFLLTHD
jgi:periplasmic protein TonB